MKNTAKGGAIGIFFKYHYLSGRCSFEETVYATDNPNFHIGFSRSVPQNPAELLGNKYFQAMILALKRYIIFHKPLQNLIN